MDFARDPVTPLRVLRPQRDTHRMPNSTPAVATLVLGVFLLVALAQISLGIWLYRTGLATGNTDVVYQVVEKKLDELLRLATMGDSIRRSLVKP